MDADAQLRNGKLLVRRLRAAAADGSVVTHGKLSLKGDKPFSFKGTVNNFDPSRFGNYRQARINSRFDATGALAPLLQLNASLDVFNSQVNGMGGCRADPLALQGHENA